VVNEFHLSLCKVDSECGKSWLNALACIARAECTLHEGTVGTGNALSEGICMLQKAELHLQVREIFCHETLCLQQNISRVLLHL